MTEAEMGRPALTNTAGNRAIRFLAAALCLCAAFPVFAQETKPLTAEIAALEQALARRPGPQEKNRAMRELARLQELSGNLEEAARFWNEAAIALPERDYDALLRCASCLAASGEFDNAAAAAQTALLSANPAIRTRALCLSGQIEAFRTGNTAPLRSLLSNAAFVPFMPAIHYTIWKVSGDAAWRSKLLADFPESPEALALGGGAVSAAPTALWLLGSAVPAGIAGTGAAGGSPGIPVETAAIAGSPAASAPEDGGPAMLQTGLFGREENARALAARLTRAGFQTIVTQKPVNGTVFWSVGVSPGQDHNRTILLLKDSGFEAFPVY